MNIFKDILSFIFSKFKIFIVILLILATAPYVWGEILNELENREILLEKATELKEVHENIPKTFDAEKSKAEKRIGKLNRSGSKVLKERIGQIDKEIAVLKSEIRTPLEIAIDTLGGDLEEVVTNKIKLGILEQERKYVEELYLPII